jgi:putative hemolysin
MPSLSYASSADSLPRTALIQGVEWVTGRRTLERHYAATRSVPIRAVWRTALNRLGVTLDVAPESPGTALPSDESVVVVANHPFGVVDGLALCHLAAQARPDFRILVNSVLCRDERVAAHFLPVDFSGTRTARRQNVRSVRTALTHLRDGGALLVFPAGGVATAPGPLANAADLDWSPLVARLVHKAEAPVVPVYFDGQNSRLFQLASQVSHTLRLALLLREALNKEGTRLPVRLGAPLPYEALASLSPDALTAHLRRATLDLGAS